MDFATFRVKGMRGEEDRLIVTNALRKYSGVEDVVVDISSNRVQVKYDPNNIIIQDMKEYLEKENYQVEYMDT